MYFKTQRENFRDIILCVSYVINRLLIFMQSYIFMNTVKEMKPKKFSFSINYYKILLDILHIFPQSAVFLKFSTNA